jgi:hypothetical protein
LPLLFVIDETCVPETRKKRIEAEIKTPFCELTAGPEKLGQWLR